MAYLNAGASYALALSLSKYWVKSSENNNYWHRLEQQPYNRWSKQRSLLHVKPEGQMG